MPSCSRPTRSAAARSPSGSTRTSRCTSQFPFTEAVSLLINCADQEEADRYWYALTDGGREVQCGWLKDRYGLSWQVFPVEAGAILSDPDPARRDRAMQAMCAMKRLDVAALRAAADGTAPVDAVA